MNVTATALLLNTLVSWLVEADGYEAWSLERKIKGLHDAMLLAVEAGQYDVADRLFAQLKQLCRETAAGA